MRRALPLAVVALALGLSGCGFLVAPVVPPTAFIFTNIDAPLDTDFQATTLGTKRGESSCMSILGIVSLGDASAAKAAQNGNIATIRSADYKYMSVLGALYTQYTTVVLGD